MITKRIIPCLDVKNGRVVKGVNFEGLQDMADPVEMARYYNASGADELVFYDITASVEGRGLFTDILRRVASQIFIPLTVGGGINTPDDFDRVLKCGADKVSVNSGAIRNPGIIPAAAQRYADTGSAPQITTPFSPKRRELPHRFPSGSVNDADQVLPGSGLEPEPDVQLSRPGASRQNLSAGREETRGRGPAVLLPVSAVPPHAVPGIEVISAELFRPDALPGAVHRIDPERAVRQLAQSGRKPERRTARRFEVEQQARRDERHAPEPGLEDIFAVLIRRLRQFQRCADRRETRKQRLVPRRVLPGAGKQVADRPHIAGIGEIVQNLVLQLPVKHRITLSKRAAALLPREIAEQMQFLPPRQLSGSGEPVERRRDFRIRQVPDSAGHGERTRIASGEPSQEFHIRTLRFPAPQIGAADQHAERGTAADLPEMRAGLRMTCRSCRTT